MPDRWDSTPPEVFPPDAQRRTLQSHVHEGVMDLVRPWVWEFTADGTARFVLGPDGDDPLVVIGINPSTATPAKLDRTVRRVEDLAARHGFDGWLMMNAYPQIATEPAQLDHEARVDLEFENQARIRGVVRDRRVTVLAAWGDLIEARPFLRGSLRGVVSAFDSATCRWMRLGERTERGHPRHPLHVRADTPLLPFDVASYLSARA